MSGVAKIFIVINLLLSAVFLAASASLLAQRWDYREMFLESKRKSEIVKTDLEEQLRELKQDQDSYEKEARQSKEEAQKQEQRALQAEKTIGELERKNKSFETTLKTIEANLAQIKTDLKQKDEQIERLNRETDQHKQNSEMALRKKEEAIDEQQKLQIDLGNLKGEVNEKEKLLQRAHKELWESKQVISAVRRAGVNIPALLTRAKALDGQVVAVSTQKDIPIVMLSIGRDDGVEKGYQFTVYRGSKYVGRVVVEEVYKDMSAARILGNLTPQQIQKGDNVTTRIGGGGSF